MAQFLKLAELMYSRSMIRQPPISRTMSRVPSVEPESAMRISSAIACTDSIQARMFRRSSLQGMSTVSLAVTMSSRVAEKMVDELRAHGGVAKSCIGILHEKL